MEIIARDGLMMILFGYFKDYLRALTDLALDFWYIVPIITIGLVVAICFERWRDYKLYRSSIYDIDSKEIGDFKRHLNDVIVRLGYVIEWTKHKDDNEVSMVASKDGVKVMLRAVRNGGAIGWQLIEESLKVMKFHGCHQLIMVTNKHFTVRAKEFAAVNGVILWDRDKLIKNLLDTKEEPAFELATSKTSPAGNECFETKRVLSMDEYLSKKGDK